MLPNPYPSGVPRLSVNSPKRTEFSRSYWLFGLAFIAILTLSPAAFASTVPSSAAAIKHQNSDYYAGYQGTVSSGQVTQVNAKWNIPQVTCQPALPVFQLAGQQTGIGNGKYQVTVGIEVYCSPGSSTPYVSATISYSRKGATVVPLGSRQLAMGDTVKVQISINLSTDLVTMKITDTTSGFKWSLSRTLTWASSANNPDWLVYGYYNGSQDLAQFTKAIKFSGCNVVVSSTTVPISSLSGVTALTLVDGSNNVLARPSALSAQGTSFKVAFVSST